MTASVRPLTSGDHPNCLSHRKMKVVPASGCGGKGEELTIGIPLSTIVTNSRFSGSANPTPFGFTQRNALVTFQEATGLRKTA